MKKNKKNYKLSKEKLLEDESITLRKSEGNGTLKRLVWIYSQGDVTHYSLAYINHDLFSGDNGRVLGYDNKHGYHHRHYMGKIENTYFKNFQDLEEQFQNEFEVEHAKAKKKK